jgi:hypothetical protein
MDFLLRKSEPLRTSRDAAHWRVAVGAVGRDHEVPPSCPVGTDVGDSFSRSDGVPVRGTDCSDGAPDMRGGVGRLLLRLEYLRRELQRREGRLQWLRLRPGLHQQLLRLIPLLVIVVVAMRRADSALGLLV